MDRATFVAPFGGVFEHSPWVAEARLGRGPARGRRHGRRAASRLCAALAPAAPRTQARADPRASGPRRASSPWPAPHGRIRRSEQASAGLDQLTDEERARFTALNDAYTEQFGFPFIIAVKGRARPRSWRPSRRLSNDRDTEFATALAQVERIALLRLKDLLP